MTEKRGFDESESNVTKEEGIRDDLHDLKQMVDFDKDKRDRDEIKNETQDREKDENKSRNKDSKEIVVDNWNVRSMANQKT